jgi:hypothetical protein
LQVRALLRGPDRRAAVVGAECFGVPLDGCALVAGLCVGDCERLGHAAVVSPAFLEATLEALDPFVRSTLRLLLKFAFDRDSLKPEHQATGGGDGGEGIGHALRWTLCVGDVAAEDPVGIAIALIGGPGVATETPGCLSRRCRRIDEALSFQQLFVEGAREHHCLRVVDRPASRDHTPNPYFDERIGHAGRELRTVIAIARLTLLLLVGEELA